MSEHAFEAAQALQLSDQLATAQDILAAHPPRASYTERIMYDNPSGAEEAEYVATADGIFDALGVVREEAVESWEESLDRATSPAVLRLRRAADVAETALEFGYDRDAPEDNLRATTSSLLEDLGALRSRAIHDSNFKESREYSERRRALTLLAESGIRELGRRNNLGDGLTPSNLQAIQEATGVHLVESEPHAYIFSAVITPRSSRPGEVGKHHQEHEKPVALRRTIQAPAEVHDWYLVPELSGPNVPRHPALGAGWVPGRIGHFALDPRYTGGRLPR